MIVDFLIGPRIRTRIPVTGYLAVKLAVHSLCAGLPSRRYHPRDFHAVSSGLVDTVVFFATPTDLGLGLVQLQVPRNGRAAKQGHADKAQCRVKTVALAFIFLLN